MNNFKRLIESVISENRPAGGKQNPNTLKIVALQKKHGYSWEKAEKIVNDEIKAAAKEAAKKLKQSQPKAPKTPKEQMMNRAQFERIMKNARKDFLSDNPGAEMDDVAYDMAGSMMYDPEIEKYVRRTIAKNTGVAPERVKNQHIIEYIADNLA